jgi:acyl-CoA reductase-like NAD-dependent aldehyde dehydrogenase
VGKQIARSTAKNLTRLSLELGGKAPAIVRSDADLTAAVRGIVGGACVMAGQMCTAISRVLVHESVATEFSAQLSQALSQVKVGPDNQPTSGMGPLIDQRNQARLLEEVRAAATDCRVLLAGHVPADTPRGGAFITPSLVATQDLNSHFVQDDSEQGHFAALRGAVKVNFFVGHSMCRIVHHQLIDLDPTPHYDLLGFAA